MLQNLEKSSTDTPDARICSYSNEEMISSISYFLNLTCRMLLLLSPSRNGYTLRQQSFINSSYYTHGFIWRAVKY